MFARHDLLKWPKLHWREAMEAPKLYHQEIGSVTVKAKIKNKLTKILQSQ